MNRRLGTPCPAPAGAKCRSGPPPASLDVGFAETIRDWAVTCASHIRQAGGRAELHIWPEGPLRELP
ncbi:hypothetical protein ACFYM3_43500 [Streptomyces massasporeus]|uniref:Uncharacterized protein n=1 Tax=Streptomyces massasporeus TaxID=67324 RepID=A0ABW6LSF9_9ACTN